jgi:hypothetical protein
MATRGVSRGLDASLLARLSRVAQLAARLRRIAQLALLGFQASLQPTIDDGCESRWRLIHTE